MTNELARPRAAAFAAAAFAAAAVTTPPKIQISFPKLKVALALAGVLLTSDELQVLQNGFRSDRSGDMVRTYVRLRGGVVVCTVAFGSCLSVYLSGIYQ